MSMAEVVCKSSVHGTWQFVALSINQNSLLGTTIRRLNEITCKSTRSLLTSSQLSPGSPSAHTQVYLVAYTGMIKWLTLFWLSDDETRMLVCAFLYLFNCRSRAHYDWKLVSDITLIMVQEVFVKCILFMTSRTDFHQILFCWIGYTLQYWKWVYWPTKMVSGKRSHGDKQGRVK